MKNIYNDKDMPQKENTLSKESVDFEDIEIRGKQKQAPPVKQAQPQQPAENADEPIQQQPVQYQENIQYQQPVYQQPFYQQPVYYVQPVQQPYPQQGVPMPPIQLTPEQIAVLLQQYTVQPQPQPYTPRPEQPATDPGTRVLYQSEDFDKPLRTPEESYDEDFELPEKKEPEEAPVPDIPAADNISLADEEDKFEIEEETITVPSRNTTPKKGTLKIEEMEMSTFELDSMLRRNGHNTPRAYNRQDFYKNQETPLNFNQSFKVEETLDETFDDVYSVEDEPKKKKNSTFEIVRRCILAVSLIAIVISAAMLLNEYRLSKENDEVEEGISDLIISVAETEPTTKKKGNKTTTNKNNENESTTAAPLTPEQQWAQIQAEYPNLIFPVGIQLKYAKLYATNQDFVGYLEAKGVNLSLPIVQTDNDSDYLERNFYGKATKYGCPFVTHVNNIVDLDQNTIIFGHHMNNGTVFGALDEYKTIDGFKAAPLITFNTLYKDYSWKVISAFITNAYEEEDNGYVFRYYFASLSTEDRFAAYLNELSQRSLYDTGVDVLPTDKLLTLSTCSHEFNEARFVIVARLVRPGESTDVDVSKATVNPNPRYPQAYYDKKKLTNPYVNASRWEVG